MIEKYELTLELGFTNSSGDHADWNVLASVSVEKLDCGDFNCVADTYLHWDERYLPRELFTRKVRFLPPEMQAIMHQEAKVKFLELKKEKEASNEQY